MAEYIDRSELLRIEKLLDTDILRKSKTASTIYDQMMYDIAQIPAADVVPRSVYDQVVWERDTALYQLQHDYGVSLGEKKPDDVAPVKRGKWIEKEIFDNGFWICSNCTFVSEATAAYKIYHFCPNCGAKMDGA